MADRPLTGILLAGGASTRFGSPKSLARFGGETLAEHAWRLLGEVCEERFVVGGDGPVDPGTGPVAAIAVGLRAAANEIAIVIPVDMPLVTADALRSLAAACREAAVAQAGPLPCAVARSALPAFEIGERRLRTVLNRLDTAHIELDERLLANVNTQADLDNLAPMSSLFRVDGDDYDNFMGRYSRLLAVRFADFAGVTPGMRVLDVGAGTGALTAELVARGASVAATDPSPQFLDTFRKNFPEVEVHEAPAEEMPFEAGAFDLALAQLVVAFVSDAPAAVAEMARIARRVAVCMWGIKEVDMFAAIDRTAAAIGTATATEPRRYRTPQEISDLLAPLGEVESAELDVTTGYRDYDEFWAALQRGVGPAGHWIASLDAEQHERAHDELRRQLGGPDGPFELNARAFAAAVTPA